jgi:hypothetical protein
MDQLPLVLMNIVNDYEGANELELLRKSFNADEKVDPHKIKHACIGYLVHYIIENKIIDDFKEISETDYEDLCDHLRTCFPDTPTCIITCGIYNCYFGAQKRRLKKIFDKYDVKRGDSNIAIRKKLWLQLKFWGVR